MSGTSSRILLPLLAAVPVAVSAGFFAPERHILIFATSVLAVVPLSAYVGTATEALAERLGAGIGGLLNATFGNAAELIIGTAALHAGLFDLVKASLTGSIIGNILLVFGASALAGGLRHPVQRFNRTAAALGTTMLLLSTIGLIVPAVFHWLSRGVERTPELELDTEIAVVLFATYCISLIFTLRTHRALYGLPVSGVGTVPSPKSRNGVWISLMTLLAATAGIAVVSELMVRTVSEAALNMGVSQLFVGVVVFAAIGNAAEHYSAVLMAIRGKMDAALAIAVGSSTQIALFVAPALVFLSYVIAPSPMDLLFTVYEIVAIALAVFSIAFIAHDGETHWMDGVQLLAVYVILSLGFLFLPA